MARAHLRHIVGDSSGSVVQNAAVFVYERGTTNLVSGMWTTAAGAVASPNPLVSNSQGEVEAWLDTARSIDLKTTDNSDAAFYPRSPASLLSWTDFTESVEVLHAPESLVKVVQSATEPTPEAEPFWWLDISVDPHELWRIS